MTTTQQELIDLSGMLRTDILVRQEGCRGNTLEGDVVIDSGRVEVNLVERGWNSLEGEVTKAHAFVFQGTPTEMLSGLLILLCPGINVSVESRTDPVVASLSGHEAPIPGDIIRFDKTITPDRMPPAMPQDGDVVPRTCLWDCAECAG